MSCYKYWGKIEEIADKLSSFGDLDNEGRSEEHTSELQSRI